MDAKTMEFIEERNGFVIRKNGDRYGYHVFHPNFDGVYLDAFITLPDAEGFCDEESIVEWEEDIRNGYV